MQKRFEDVLYNIRSYDGPAMFFNYNNLNLVDLTDWGRCFTMWNENVDTMD